MKFLFRKANTDFLNKNITPEIKKNNYVLPNLKKPEPEKKTVILAITPNTNAFFNPVRGAMVVIGCVSVCLLTPEE